MGGDSEGLTIDVFCREDAHLHLESMPNRIQIEGIVEQFIVLLNNPHEKIAIGHSSDEIRLNAWKLNQVL
jgi:hypothetical protein